MPHQRSLAAPSQVWSLGPAFQNPSDEQILRLVQQAQAPVTLHVYAVGRDERIQHLNQITLNLLNFGGIFHAGIEVYGKEFSFGRLDEPGLTGVFSCPPRMCTMHRFRQSVFLGDCRKKPKEVSALLQDLERAWLGKDYSVLRKNCCYFAEAFSIALNVGKIPDWVNSFALIGAKMDSTIHSVLETLHLVEPTHSQEYHKDKSHFMLNHPANNVWHTVA